MSYNRYSPGGHWEYEMFTEVLTSTRYPEKEQFVVIQSNDDHPIGKTQEYGSRQARLIDKAARNLLQRVGAQGWEAVDACDAGSLWAKGRVRYGEVSAFKSSADGSSKVELTTVSIFCRRRIQQRTKDSFVTPLAPVISFPQKMLPGKEKETDDGVSRSRGE